MWPLSQGQCVGQVALRSAEECLEAWRHIRPYAESVQADRRLLARLQGALTLIVASLLFARSPPLHDLHAVQIQ